MRIGRARSRSWRKPKPCRRGRSLPIISPTSSCRPEDGPGSRPRAGERGRPRFRAEPGQDLSSAQRRHLRGAAQRRSRHPPRRVRERGGAERLRQTPPAQMHRWHHWRERRRDPGGQRGCGAAAGQHGNRVPARHPARLAHRHGQRAIPDRDQAAAEREVARARPRAAGPHRPFRVRATPPLGALRRPAPARGDLPGPDPGAAAPADG